jgi:ribosomal protein S18 acetylase RimI-like enzyme
VSDVRLRPAEASDRPFLLDVYAGTRADELALVPWDDATKRAFVEQQFAAQEDHYSRHYAGATVDVIEVGGESAGRLYVFRGPGDIRIVDITLLPAFRGRGAGSLLLHGLIDEAQAGGRKLSIHVEMNNPARSLYDRLGFAEVETHGVYVLMERVPVS